MGDNTKIEWSDATWNPIVGCTVISEGCRNCYAMRLAGGRMKNHPTRQGLTRENAAGKPVWNGQVRLIEEALDQPLRWRRPRKIFVGAHTDLFQDAVPSEWLHRLFAVMHRCPQHTFQILTKRPARMKAFMQTQRWMPNVWLGVSAEDQATADERIPLLLDTPAAVRWLSAEPLLGPIDLGWQTAGLPTAADALDLVVAGGESGPGARPMHPDWARELRDQCARVGTAFFFKQWGDWLPWGQLDANGSYNTVSFGEDPERFQDWHNLPGFTSRLGKKLAGRFLDGRTHDDMPVVEVRS